MKLKDLGEFGLIDRFSRGISLSRKVIKGIGDDTAVLRYRKDRYLLFTTDMFIEDRHFRRSSGGFLVGKKALSANISDIASMGGFPTFMLVSLGVPGSLEVSYVDDIYRGIKKVCRMFDVDLAGGDTVYSEKIVINIALMGEVEKENLVLRSNAEEGDHIFVTGDIGGSIKGKHLGFSPRLKEARFLVKNFKIRSMIDVSDGLLSDLGHILTLSKKGAVIYGDSIPISRHARDFGSAVRDGEDFEMLFTLSAREADKLIEKWPFKTRLSRIGKICSRGKGFSLVKAGNRTEKIRKNTGYTHF